MKYFQVLTKPKGFPYGVTCLSSQCQTDDWVNIEDHRNILIFAAKGREGKDNWSTKISKLICPWMYHYNQIKAIKLFFMTNKHIYLNMQTGVHFYWFVLTCICYRIQGLRFLGRSSTLIFSVWALWLGVNEVKPLTLC